MSLVWKQQAKQQAHGGPLVKLEVLQTATVVRLINAAEYRAIAPALRRPAAPAASRVPVPDAPTPFPAQAGAQTPRVEVAANNHDAKQEIHQLGALYALCADEAGVLLKRDIAAAEVTAAADKIFTQAARQAVHQKIDVASFWLARDPEVAAKLGFAASQLPPHVAQMAELIGDSPDRERKANKMLRELKHIAHNQTWRDLDDTKAAEILRAGFFQLALAA